jgi:hypothetical protein
MNLRKKAYLTLFCMVFLVSGSGIGTFAFLSQKVTNKENCITIATLPKPFVKLYASIGPLYRNHFINYPDYESTSYKDWLENASSYIICDVQGGNPQGPIGKDYKEFKNIPNNNTELVSVKDDISSSKFRSWRGDEIKKESNVYEDGSLMHNLMVIGTPAREGVSFGKIKINDIGLQINQSDIFQNVQNKDKAVKNNEYSLPRDATKLNVSENKNRLVTYDFIQGKYVKTGSGNGKTYVPADEADLIVFDIGSKGYSVITDKSPIQPQLNQLQQLLSGKREYANKSNDNWTTPWTGSMEEMVMNKMVPNGDLKCRLDRTECAVTFNYNGYKVPIQTYIVNYEKLKDTESKDKADDKIIGKYSIN